MRCARAQVDPFLRAHAPFPLEFLYHDWTLEDKLLSRLVSKGNGPAAVFIEAFQCIDEVAVEGVTSHLSIGNHVDARVLLERDGLVDRPIFYGFELCRVELPCRELLTSL